MKPGINKLFVIVLMGVSLAFADETSERRHTTETGGNTQSTGPSGSGATASQGTTQPTRPIDAVRKVFDVMVKYTPYRDMHSTAQAFTSFLTNPPQKQEDREKISKEIVEKISKTASSEKDLQDSQKKEQIAKDLTAVAASTAELDKSAVNGFAQTVAAKDEAVKFEKTLSQFKDSVEQDKKTAEEKAAKEKEQAAKEKALKEREEKKAAENEALQNAVQQAALQAAQAAGGAGNGGKGGGSGSGGGNGGGNRSQPPEPPKFGENQPKHDSLSDQLDKALNQKNNSPDLSSLFNNNNNNSFGSGSNKEKKDEKDGFKFDISPKTTQNEVKPVKAAASSGDSVASSPMDPSDPKNLSGNPDEFLNGPTSVPQLAQAIPVNPALAGGDGGGGGATKGFSGGVKGGAPGIDNSGAQEIFQGVGRLDYGQSPPPIRKASADLGGEYSGSGEEGYTYSNNNGLSKKEPLVNELVFIRDESRRRGKGLMAFVGYQMKDICSKPGAATSQIFCKIKRRIKKEETVSLNK